MVDDVLDDSVLSNPWDVGSDRVEGRSDRVRHPFLVFNFYLSGELPRDDSDDSSQQSLVGVFSRVCSGFASWLIFSSLRSFSQFYSSWQEGISDSLRREAFLRRRGHLHQVWEL